MGWQCRIRQYAVRKDEGRPSTGMMPELTAREQSVGPINVQLVKTASDESTAQFRFMYQKTVDPKDRRTAVLKLLADHADQHHEQAVADADKEKANRIQHQAEL